MPRTTARTVAALIGAGALLVACGSTTRNTTSGTTAPPDEGSVEGTNTTAIVHQIHWVACKGSAGPSGYQCATVLVPRNPEDASGPDISMAVDRKPATGRSVIGSLVTNPGGPGASGVDSLPLLIQSMPASLLARFDVVGFDPPGVERTAPITCLSNAGLDSYFNEDPDPPTQAGFNAMVASDRTFAEGCEAMSGSELPYVSTVDAAIDMNYLRQDLGDAKLTYLGFSYGTFLGATYAELFPTKVRAMVLDGALDPALPVVTELVQQSAAIEKELQLFFTWCASAPSCGWNPGSNPTAAFESLENRVRAHPLHVSGTSRTVGPAELLYGAAVTLYSPENWQDLGQALQAADQGNGSILLQLFDDYIERNSNGSYVNVFEANSAINCLDAPAPSLAQIEGGYAEAEAVAPIFGVANLYSEAQCAVWPVAATGHPAPIHDQGAPPIVVVGSTGDPVTPYAWAQALAKQLDHGVLLTRLGDGHTAYQFSSCIRNWVDGYLTTLALPPAGTQCPTN